MLLFCNYKTNVITDEKTKSRKAIGGKRVMYANHSPVYDAKNRFGLPDVMEMDFSEIAHVFKSPDEQKSDTIGKITSSIKDADVTEEAILAYLESKGQTASSLKELPLKTLQFINANITKILNKIQEDK